MSWGPDLQITLSAQAGGAALGLVENWIDEHADGAFFARVQGGMFTTGVSRGEFAAENVTANGFDIPGTGRVETGGFCVKELWRLGCIVEGMTAAETGD